MKIVVTGASGLIGGEVCCLLRDQHAIVSWGRTDPEIDGVTHHLVDATSDLDLDLSGVDAVIHLAQSPDYRDLPASIADVEAVNVRFTARLAEAARRAGCAAFVNASSGSVYRTSPDAEPPQLADLNDISLYGATKRAGEFLLAGYREYMRVVSLRYFMVFGRGQDEKMMIPSLVGRIARGDAVQLQGRDGLVFTPTHVSDAASATIRALDAPSGAYDVCGSDQVSLREVGETIASALDTEARFEIREGRSPHLTGRQPEGILGVAATRALSGIFEVAEELRYAGTAH
jgi:nucleoside-diphosphate-sugar epimerase